MLYYTLYTYLPLLLVISGEARRRKASDNRSNISTSSTVQYISDKTASIVARAETTVTAATSSTVHYLQKADTRNLKVIRVDSTNNTSGSSEKHSGNKNNQGGRRGSSGSAHSSTIWSWDVWCQFQPVTLNCSDKKIQYYYDTQVDQCVIFDGCSGFKNHFSSKSDCELYCKGASYTKVKGLPASMYCNLQPDVGVCMSYMMRYYFDVNEKTCKEFAWGGCGGNQNRYESLQSCKSECLLSMRANSDENPRRTVFIV